jgi:uncharacterized membrane protein
MASLATSNATDSRSTAVSTGRIPSLDLLRGAVMVIMAIDHTRDFFTNLTFEPESLSQTWMALFLTRWITHFCAPLFFFLAGTGAFYYGARRTPSALSRFLVTRGVWLMVVEFTLVGTAWTFTAPWGFFGVIWCLGMSMVVLAALVRLPVRWLAGLSAAVILLHDLTDTYRPGPGTWTWVWRMLHVKGGVHIFGMHNFVLFPLVPWFALMALGFCFGALLQRPDKQKWLLRLGIGLTLAFLLLRSTNLYGNPPALPGGVTPGNFHLQPTLEKTVILFLDTEKYPPSLQFLLMTLGPSLLLLAAVERYGIPGWAKPLVVFGRVPFFFYVLHLYLIHGLAVLAAIAFHQPYSWLLHGGFWLNEWPEGYGHGLAFVYLAWAVVLVILYYPCRWFAGMKEQRKSWWLSYF